jgi:uncharacterized protein (DUF1501 family)
MGIIHAAGLDYDTRSHFDAMEFMELGTPGNKSTATGWITRHLQSAPLPVSGLLPVACAPSQPSALLGNAAAISLSSPDDLSQWDNGFLAEQQTALRRLYAGGSVLHQSGLRTLDALSAIAPLREQEYRPQNGARYREDDLGRQFQTIARLLKMEGGLRVATIDYGGWDTHEHQNYDEGGYLGDMLASLGENLANFYLDLDSGYTQKLSVVVLSEFGRRLAQNDSNGTDHGHGSVMLALGGSLNGGKIYADWRGLANDQLYDRADLAVTTDYRQILGELLTLRLGNPNLETVFPGFSASYRPLGLFA